MNPTPAYRGRFAPSPTGLLHAGSMLAAFGSWLLARQAGGEWIVRIEDIDPPRTIPGAAEAQLQALHACGLDSDAPVTWQSRRGALYQTALERLLSQGDAFLCHCSRSELLASGGIHRGCAPGKSRPDPAIRFRVAGNAKVAFEDRLQGHVEQDVASTVGDFVLKRADGLWAYQLAVVVDDAEQGITHVVRGADLLDSTPRQILLQRALGLPTPHYLHLPLLLDREGNKLSKSTAATAVDTRRPLSALRCAWNALGQDETALHGIHDVQGLLQQALACFEPQRLPVRHASRRQCSLYKP